MNEVTVEDLGYNNFYITHLDWILRFVDLKKNYFRSAPVTVIYSYTLLTSI
jgi:hypothetical protein